MSALTSRVAETREGWDRSATDGAVALKDTNEFDQLGVTIEVQDTQDAQGGGMPQ